LSCSDKNICIAGMTQSHKQVNAAAEGENLPIGLRFNNMTANISVVILSE